MTEPGAIAEQHVLTVNDIRDIASKKMPKMYREYFNGGAMEEITLRDNEDAFNRYKIRPRVLVNVGDVDTSTTIFGHKITFPLGFSPAAMHQLAHNDGETATSRAAAKFNIPMILSAYSTKSLEEIAGAGGSNPYAMQVSVLRDRGTTLQILQRAEKAGYKAVFVAVDVPILGRRLNEHRNGFAMPKGMAWPNLLADGQSGAIDGKSGHIAYDATLDWNAAIPWLKANTKLEIWLKGITTPADIHLAASHNLTGVLISNHGGRQLDSVPSTLDSLRDCADALAAAKATCGLRVAMDGGVRRGTDIFKALALGAECVFVGRVPIWGLAYKGQEGVEEAVGILLDEFRSCMALAGCRTVKDITREHLSVLGANGALCKL